MERTKFNSTELRALAYQVRELINKNDDEKRQAIRDAYTPSHDYVKVKELADKMTELSKEISEISGEVSSNFDYLADNVRDKELSKLYYELNNKPYIYDLNIESDIVLASIDGIDPSLTVDDFCKKIAAKYIKD